MKKTSRLALALVTMFIVHQSSLIVLGQVPRLINYQGRLVDDGTLVNATTTMVFRLYDEAVGGSLAYVETQSVTVVDGLYATAIGSASASALEQALTKSQIYIEVQVGPTILTPRERLKAVAYAITAAGVEDGAITTAMLGSSAVTGSKIANSTITASDLAANSVGGSEIQDDAVTEKEIVNESILFEDIAQNGANAGEVMKWSGAKWAPAPDETGGGGPASDAWNLTGNAGTTNGVHFVGTTDNTPLELRVNDVRALRLTSGVEGPNVVAGGAGNNVAGGTSASTIGGGQSNKIPATADFAVIGGGDRNTVGFNDDYVVIGGGEANAVGNNNSRATVSGGGENRILPNAAYATISGGRENSLGTNTDYAAVGGGYQNTVGKNSQSAVIAGGNGNTIGENAAYAAIPSGWQNAISNGAGSATIGGGYRNTIGDDSKFSVVAGGSLNRIGPQATNNAILGGKNNSVLPEAVFATVAGGHGNTVGGHYSFAAGRNAFATNDGSFVWGDSQGTAIRSTDDDQFLIRAQGGVGVGTDAPGNPLEVSGEGTPAGASFGSQYVVARFRNTLDWPAQQHTAIAIDTPFSSTDAIIYFSREGQRHWELRAEGDTDEFKMRHELVDNFVLTADGDLTVGRSYHYETPQTNAIYYTAPDFESTDPDGSGWELDQDGTLYVNYGIAWTGMVGVVCPQGARLERLSAHARVHNGGGGLRVDLVRYNQLTTNVSYLSSVVTNISGAGAPDIVETATTTIFNRTVDNTAYRYLLLARFTKDSIVSADGFIGARIDYSMTEVRP